MHEDAAFALDSAAHDGAEEAASLFASIAMAAVQVPEPPPPKPAAPSFTSFLPPPKDNESADLFANMTLADIVAPTVSAETGFGTAFGAEATPAAAPAAFSFGVPDTQAEPNPFAFAAADAAVACADGADDAPGEASGSGEGSIATACPSAAADDAVTIAVVGAPKAFKSTFIRLAQGVKADGKYTRTSLSCDVGGWYCCSDCPPSFMYMCVRTFGNDDWQRPRVCTALMLSSLESASGSNFAKFERTITLCLTLKCTWAIQSCANVLCPLTTVVLPRLMQARRTGGALLVESYWQDH